MRPFYLLLLAVLILLVAEEANAWKRFRCKFNRRARGCNKTTHKKTTTAKPTPAPEPTPNVVSRLIIVPGFLGSQLRAKLVNSGKRKHTVFDYLLLLQPMAGFKTHQNLTVTPYKFGKTRGVECVFEDHNKKCLAPSPITDTVDFFASKPDFQRDVDIRGAPYNYRYGPDGLERDGFFQNLKSLIEKTYNGRGVTIMGHSMGGLLSLHFLNNIVDQAWKDKYVESFITLGTGFGGTVYAARAIISGVSKPFTSFAGIKLTGILGTVQRKLTSNIVRTWPGLFYNLPKPQVFKDRDIIVSNGKGYTAGQLLDIFTQSRIPVPPNFECLQTAALRNPGVPTYCMYGLTKGKSTEDKVIYNRLPSKATPKIVKGKGDHVIPLISLDACKEFGLTSDPETNVRNFPKAGHLGIVKDDKMLEMVYEMVKKKEQA